jgi:hypothetical protein
VSREAKVPQVDRKNKILQEVGELIRREVEKRHGTALTFEQRRDAAATVVAEELWLDEEQDLQRLVEQADEITIEGQRYRRLDQPSSAEYHGRWGMSGGGLCVHREGGETGGDPILSRRTLIG